MKKRSTIGLILIPVLLAAEPVWTEGEHGLWRLQFADGTYLSAADVATNCVRGACTVTRDGAVTRRVWRTDRADVTVIETPTGDGAVDLRAEGLEGFTLFALSRLAERVLPVLREGPLSQ